MYRGNNPSALRSQEAIAQSCVTLLKDMPLEQITIKEMMAGSDLARQTFYQVFDTKDEVIEYHLDGLFGQYLRTYDIAAVNNLCDTAKLFFRFFELHRDFVTLIVRNSRTCLLQRKCRGYLEREGWIEYRPEVVQDKKEHQYAISFIISGIVGMLADWIEENYQTDVEELANLVCRITRSEDDSEL